MTDADRLAREQKISVFAVRIEHAEDATGAAARILAREALWLLDQLAAERQARAEIERRLAEAMAQLGWIDDAEEGRDVSDFAASFPLVRAILDLRQARAALEQQWRDEADLHEVYLPSEYHSAAIEYKRRCADQLRALLPGAGEGKP